MVNIIDEAKKYMINILGNDSSGHDEYHCFRVYKNALEIAKDFNVDLMVVSLAALLHDLDDPKISRNTNHVERFLDIHNIKDKDHILDIIENMSYSSSKLGKKVTTIEGQIVQDADRLDALGAIGIARCFAYSGYKNRPLYKGDDLDDSAIAHFYQKLFKLPDLMNTKVAKKIADKRVLFMKEYLDEFYLEW